MKPSAASTPPGILTLTLAGHVPSFKNTKLWTGKKLITAPKKQTWMKAAIASLKSQLLSRCPTGADATSMACALRSWIASLPPDDNCAICTSLSIRVTRVPKGNEHAQITISQVNQTPTTTP